MSYEFKKLSEIDIVEEVTDEATVLVEDGGDVKRTSMSNIKGSSCVAIDMNKINNEFVDVVGVTSSAFTKSTPAKVISDDDYDAIIDAYRNHTPCYFYGVCTDEVTKMGSSTFAIVKAGNGGSSSSYCDEDVIVIMIYYPSGSGMNIMPYYLYKASYLKDIGFASQTDIAKMKEYLVSKGYSKS